MHFSTGKAEPFYWLLVCIVSIGYASGQSPTTRITPESVQLPYLEYLVKAQIDSIRKTRELPSLVSDSSLYVSAKDHVQYLSEEPVTTPYQKHSNKKTAQDRAYFHGARNYLTEENILSFKLADTYQATARRIASAWAKSNKYMRNIENTDFQVTGVAIVPHQKNGNFIVVQDFARVLWRYSFYTNRRMFPYDTVRSRSEQWFSQSSGKKEKLPWKLKHLDYKQTKKNSIWTAFRSEKLQLLSDYTNQIIFARSVTPLQLLHSMKNRRDGIAVELVNFKSYQCGSSDYYKTLGRRTGSSSVNGKVLQPVYKKELLSSLRKQKREFNRDKSKQLRKLWLAHSAKAKREKEKIKKETWKPEFTSVPVGNMLKVDSNGYIVANFLLLHKKRIIGAVHYTDICGDLNFTDSVAFETRFSDHQLSFKPDDKFFDFRVPFERNSIRPDHKSMLAIRDTLKNYQIDNIRIDAYASVEGVGGMNEQLYKSRADSIVGYLKKYIDDNTNIEVRTSENWTLLYDQLENSAYSAWKDWPVDQIKQELQKPEVLKAWEQNLNEQRKAQVRLATHLQVRDTLEYIRQHYKVSNPIQAAALQNFYYRQWKQGSLPADSLFSVQYPATAQYSDLKFNQMLLDYQLNHNSWTAQQWQTHWEMIKTALAVRNTGIEMKYYAVAFMLSEWEFAKEQNYSADQILKLIDGVVHTEKYKTLDKKLKSMFYLKALPYYQQEGNYRKLKEGVQYLFAYYRDKPEIIGNNERSLSLANYMIEMEAFKYAIQVLDTYLKKTGFDEDIYMQYLKLVFVHPDYQKNRTYTRLLVEAAQKLPHAKWCDLFIGECRINFQVFDDEQLRNLYCEKCVGMGNEANQTTK